MLEHDDIGLWAERLTNKSFVGRPALFLDRDGVVVQEVHFLRAPEDLRLTSNISAAIAAANAADVAVVLITNQSGIARGKLDWKDFAAVQHRLVESLEADGAHLDLVLACGYHPEGTGALAREHPWRKPSPGMLWEAAARLGIDLARSCIVGDRISDLEAGFGAGLRYGAMVRDGYGAEHWQRYGAKVEQWRTTQGLTIIEAYNGAAAAAQWLAGLKTQE